MDISQIETELEAKYGFSKICEVHESVEDALKGFYTFKAPGYYPEPFVVDVFNDWNELGVTLISCGDNNMGQWIEMVKVPNLTINNFANEKHN